MRTMIAKPAKGKVVRHPSSMVPLPAEGALVGVNSYWNRRLQDGDITLSEPDVAEPKKVKSETEQKNK